MAFTTEATLKGFNRRFSVSPECRPYTLRDNGFMETKGGNFQYKRKLDTEHRNGLILKVTVKKDLKTLKISTVTNNELSAVDVTKLENNAMILEKINFIFDGFVDRNVMIEK
ncbi:cysteine desulfurase [Tuanshanicoccus lijuaniae]|uniref:cysteine desulfurase n=1 Tax=Aerococcaceae bacterium zg-1292 TaxID=2774330 RepID=UPI001BD8958B|nr:cysteine desulfurase [Aerococcaceae bacterium zg-BR9]MBF6977744.1 cysteine desulfurase [Aerococcaceae bacterium zg-BR22]MBS4456516.1 cysteine desulfurase [Aerococcaceae bacterium zg-A91]MBS4458617.1 cysteine desulfurase [Aerococcaceae bacterium zg-BR33]